MRIWLNVSEGAEFAGVCRDTIYTACERGELHHISHRWSALDSSEAGVDRPSGSSATPAKCVEVRRQGLAG